ncbi:hypothetical protein LX90_004837 [Lentzea flava]|nr:hypothetical protein [Lentzea flava]
MAGESRPLRFGQRTITHHGVDGVQEIGIRTRPSLRSSEVTRRNSSVEIPQAWPIFVWWAHSQVLRHRQEVRRVTSSRSRAGRIPSVRKPGPNGW